MNARSVSNNGVLHALTRIRLKAGAFTMATVLTLTFAVSSTSVYAQSTSGALYGKAAAGSTVTVVSTDTGATRTATAASDGAYRIGALTPGNYKVSFSDGTSKDVSVSLGTNSLVSTGSEVLELEKFTVGGNSVNPIDFGNTEAVTIFNEKTVDMLPVARNTTAIALLAPGTTLGDGAFGNLASFGGASVAENAYFVNGMNITNFRNGLGSATVPFEFYKEFEVKTGGYSAEFGRSTGGVVSTSTKSGSNEFHGGFNYYIDLDVGRKNSPNVTNPGTGNPYVYNGGDYRQEWTANAYASGPLWKNKLFFYGLYQMHDFQREDIISSGSRLSKQSADAPFWGAKLDFYPISGQHFEYTAFTDKETTTTTDVDYDFASKRSLGTNESQGFAYAGGDTRIARYTGTFFEKLNISAMWGTSTQNRTSLSSEDLKPAVYEAVPAPSCMSKAIPTFCTTMPRSTSVRPSALMPNTPSTCWAPIVSGPVWIVKTTPPRPSASIPVASIIAIIPFPVAD